MFVYTKQVSCFYTGGSFFTLNINYTQATINIPDVSDKQSSSGYKVSTVLPKLLFRKVSLIASTGDIKLHQIIKSNLKMFFSQCKKKSTFILQGLYIILGTLVFSCFMINFSLDSSLLLFLLFVF